MKTQAELEAFAREAAKGISRTFNKWHLHSLNYRVLFRLNYLGVGNSFRALAVPIIVAFPMFLKLSSVT